MSMVSKLKLIRRHTVSDMNRVLPKTSVFQKQAQEDPGYQGRLDEAGNCLLGNEGQDMTSHSSTEQRPAGTEVRRGHTWHETSYRY